MGLVCGPSYGGRAILGLGLWCAADGAALLRAVPHPA